jgi:hypothetical protein
MRGGAHWRPVNALPYATARASPWQTRPYSAPARHHRDRGRLWHTPAIPADPCPRRRERSRVVVAGDWAARRRRRPGRPGSDRRSAMKLRSHHQKVFGPGRAVPRDRKRQGPHCRLCAHLARPPQDRKGTDHPHLHGRAGGPAMGLPQRPYPLLLPVLRGDRCQGGVRPIDCGGGPEGAGVGRRADLATPDHPDPRALSRPIRP